MEANIYEKIRQVRVLKKITLKELAKKCGLSYSYISQVERGEASPSLASLDRLSKALDMDVWHLFKDENGRQSETGLNANSIALQNGQSNAQGNNDRQGKKKIRPTKLLKKNMRRSITLPQTNVCYEMITPDLKCEMQVLRMEAEVGASSGDYMIEHEGEECCFVLSGQLEMEVGGEKYLMEAGDSVYFSSELPHRWENKGGGNVTMLLILTPPAY